MQRVAFISQKGGVGKSTLTVHLAVAAWQAGQKVAVLNTDPQASAGHGTAYEKPQTLQSRRCLSVNWSAP